jgi:hypothetical protein
MIHNNYITTINDDIYTCFLLSPFTNIELVENKKLKNSQGIYSYFNDRFRLLNYQLTINGRHAINLALKELKPVPESFVTIVTTSNNKYVSRCVTDEISKFCNWDRTITKNTSIIFLIHEFGYPIGNTQEYLKYGLPVIEDCAYSFNSKDENNTTGKTGDFIIYSLPKYFPVQLGGMLVSKRKLPEVNLPWEVTRYVENTISHYLHEISIIEEKRINNYDYFLEKSKELPISPRFPFKDGIIPGVFLFNITCKCDLDGMKVYFEKMGVQCSVFYGENAFFLPVHQNINHDHIDFFIALLRNYLNT